MRQTCGKPVGRLEGLCIKDRDHGQMYGKDCYDSSTIFCITRDRAIIEATRVLQKNGIPLSLQTLAQKFDDWYWRRLRDDSDSSRDSSGSNQIRYRTIEVRETDIERFENPS